MFVSPQISGSWQSLAADKHEERNLTKWDSRRVFAPRKMSLKTFSIVWKFGANTKHQHDHRDDDIASLNYVKPLKAFLLVSWELVLCQSANLVKLGSKAIWIFWISWDFKILLAGLVVMASLVLMLHYEFITASFLSLLEDCGYKYTEVYLGSSLYLIHSNLINESQWNENFLIPREFSKTKTMPSLS